METTGVQMRKKHAFSEPQHPRWAFMSFHQDDYIFLPSVYSEIQANLVPKGK